MFQPQPTVVTGSMVLILVDGIVDSHTFVCLGFVESASRAFSVSLHLEGKILPVPYRIC